MTEQELITVLAIVGNLMEGEITLRKKSGDSKLEVEMDTHPIWGIYFLSDALGQTLYRAGHTGDDLELDLTGDNAQLAEGEILLYSNRDAYEPDTLTVFDRTYRIVGRPDNFLGNGVMEADIDSDVDAHTVAEAGAKAIQLHTGGMCHLTADMTMQGLEADTVGGYNSMLEKQKKEPGSANVTTVLFSSDISLLHDRVPIEEVKALTDREYRVGGMTALLDAIGDTVNRMAAVQKALTEDQKAGKVIVVIITDGYENSSREYSYDKVKGLLERLKAERDWEFLFLGANMDAVKEARRFGIGADRASSYVNDSKGIARSFGAVGGAVSSLRNAPGGSAVGAEWKRELEKDVKERGGDS